jgi:hypothetical protein
MPALSEVPEEVSYLIKDADEHSTPRRGAYAEYIDPDKASMATRSVHLDEGTWQQSCNGRQPRSRRRSFR